MTDELPQGLKNLITDLIHQSVMDNSIVTEIVQSNKLCAKELDPFVTFHHKNCESYGRKPIFDNGIFKILLMSWKAGDFTAIHNHGNTEWGCVYFFGDTTHRLYQVENDELKVVQKDNFYKGQIAPVCGDLTHMMGNAGNTNFTTLHIYGSTTNEHKALENARVYFPEFKKVVTTMGSAFLNIDKGLILSEEPFEKIDNETLTDYYNLVKPFYERNNLAGLLEKIQH
jgi:hypothetical protein